MFVSDYFIFHCISGYWGLQNSKVPFLFLGGGDCEDKGELARCSIATGLMPFILKGLIAWHIVDAQ